MGERRAAATPILLAWLAPSPLLEAAARAACAPGAPYLTTGGQSYAAARGEAVEGPEAALVRGIDERRAAERVLRGARRRWT
jgi:hypothetical protein